jgi:hypothetical protein
MATSRRTLADYVAGAISPALIITLVASLVFFLVEVLYVGQYQGRILWFFFFFVFGAVLVSHMSLLTELGNRAGLYGVILGALMWLALQMYLQFPPETLAAQCSWAVNLGLIAILWWSAHRLTVDSTFVDERDNVSGQGLMDAAGLDRPAEARAGEEEIIPVTDEEDDANKAQEPKRVSGLLAWWERYQAYRADQRQRPRTHGVWVVYFSLAALPLFGIGQSLIPPDQVGRRRYVFWLLLVYLLSGLGLLLTTNFLSLRRYLRQRKVDMPVTITGVWLSFGLGLILFFLALAALLPRPNPEFPIWDTLAQATSPKRDASQFAVKGDGEPGEGEGRAGDGNKGEQGDKASGQGKGSGDQKGQASGKQSSNSGAKGRSDSGQSSQGKNQQGGSQSGKNNGGSSGKGQKSSQSGKSSSNSGKQQNDNGGKQNDGKNSGNKDANAGKDQQKQGEAAKDGKQSTSSSGQSTPPPPPPPLGLSWLSWLQPLLAVLKWIVIGAIILIVIIFVLRAILGFLANFTGWAGGLLGWFRSWWEALWRSRRSEQQGATAVAAPPSKPHRPFNSYRDPFLTGQDEDMAPAELIRYSFEALEAWARENDLARAQDETPLEFTARVGREVPELDKDTRRLARYYAAAAYAPRFLGDDYADGLRRFWLTLKEVAEPYVTTETDRG